MCLYISHISVVAACRSWIEDTLLDCVRLFRKLSDEISLFGFRTRYVAGLSFLRGSSNRNTTDEGFSFYDLIWPRPLSNRRAPLRGDSTCRQLVLGATYNNMANKCDKCLRVACLEQLQAMVTRCMKSIQPAVMGLRQSHQYGTRSNESPYMLEWLSDKGVLFVEQHVGRVATQHLTICLMRLRQLSAINLSTMCLFQSYAGSPCMRCTLVHWLPCETHIFVFIAFLLPPLRFEWLAEANVERIVCLELGIP